jgi:PhnB protein
MNDIKLPDGYNYVMPYLIVQNARGCMDFIIAVMSGEEHSVRLREDGKVMHGEVSVGNGMIMLSEATDVYKPCTAGMFVYVPNADSAYARALESGATSVMAPGDMPYGRSCGVTDVQGNTWWMTSVPAE